MFSWVLSIIQLFLLLAEIVLASFWLVGSGEYNYEAAIVLIGVLITVIQLFKKKLLKSAKSISRIGVVHYTSGVEAWKLGLSGFLLRIRGIVLILIFIIGLFAGLAYWQSMNSFYVITIDKDFRAIYLVYVVLIVVAVLFYALIFYVKQRSQRSLIMKNKLHRLLHVSRDEVCKLISRTAGVRAIKNKTKTEYEKELIINYSTRTCNNISSYFKVLIGDRSLTCAIRLAYVEPENEGKGLSYVTVGRCNNFNAVREKTTESIPSNIGIPKFFSEVEINNQGVLFYDDLDLAEKNGAYFRTFNDKKFPSDIRSIIVAPLNGWNGEEIGLIGLLYINSKEKKILNPIHADLIAFTADTLALTYTSIYSHLHNVKNMPEF